MKDSRINHWRKDSSKSVCVNFQEHLQGCWQSIVMREVHMYDFSILCKMKRENGISHLISTLGVNCKFT